MLVKIIKSDLDIQYKDTSDSTIMKLVTSIAYTYPKSARNFI